MIVDFINNWHCYSKGNQEVWREAFDFIASVTPDTEAKKYSIRGDELFALVQDYNTKPVNDGSIEIHRQYADIHVLISGKELIYYSSIALLEQIKDFTPQSDDVLYTFKEDKSIGIPLLPGMFALFLPEEGHMPAINLDASNRIKKVLIKVHKDLLY
ncbi:YhcH/YjgK/YiaL family protein [Chitinophaga sp. MM2321]|uniref:YhcH/YjgK/YiaL family protein n=1 Tax=Chitinophaga sp. MM2321 TaxID=3137178 RepID=UPI0032D56855